MKKLLLTSIIVASAASLQGMQVAQKQVSPITLPQTYYHLVHDVQPQEHALLPDIAQYIFLLQLKASGIDLEELPQKIEQSCKDPYYLGEYINTLIASCGYLLASELCQRFFPHAKISICEIKDEFNKSALHHAVKWNREVAKLLLGIAGDKAYTLLTMQNYYGQTELHSAACDKDIEVAKFLLDSANDNAYNLLAMQGNDGRTALHYTTTPHYVTRFNVTTWHDGSDMAKLLLNSAGDNAYDLLTIQSDDGTALYSAVCDKNIEVIKLILDTAGDKAKDLISMPNKYGKTAFEVATPKIKEVMKKYISADTTASWCTIL